MSLVTKSESKDNAFYLKMSTICCYFLMYEIFVLLHHFHYSLRDCFAIFFPYTII